MGFIVSAEGEIGSRRGSSQEGKVSGVGGSKTWNIQSMCVSSPNRYRFSDAVV